MNVSARQNEIDESSRSKITKLFNDARKRLVETGTRNRLVHVNRANTRGNVLNIIQEQADSVYASLTERKLMRFIGLGSDKEETDDSGMIEFAGAKMDSLESHHNESALKTRLGPQALQTKLLKIAQEARTAEEESGINILYLAIGFLTWFEDKSSSVAREAPLILLPVELIRNARTSIYDMKMRDDDISTNLPLQQRLKDDFDIDFPDIEPDEHWSPSSYFPQIAEVVAQHSRWKIDPDAMQLGFFSFSKLLMHRDLAVETWPEGALATHALTRGLLYEGFAGETSMFESGVKLDDALPPDMLFHVVDADASQAKVIEEVRLGRNVVVQGPPGAGKSQTITNIVATAVKEGKRVLFIAEKMAALSVVHDRLVKVGLRDVCLELHSRSANRKAVLGELARTIAQGAAIPTVPGAPVKLKEALDRLNLLTETLHRPIDATGETASSVLGRQASYMGAGRSPPTLKVAGLTTMTRETEREMLDIIERYGAILEKTDAGGNSAYGWARNLDLQPVDVARLAVTLETAASHIDALKLALREPLLELNANVVLALDAVDPTINLLERLEGLPAGSVDLAKAVLQQSDFSRLSMVAQNGAEWREAHDRVGQTFDVAAVSAPVSDLRAPLAAGANSFFARWGKAYRTASQSLAGLLRVKLPKTATERVKLIDDLLAMHLKRAAWEVDAPYSQEVLGEEWRGDRTDFALLQAVIDWCRGVAAASMACAPDGLLTLAANARALAEKKKVLLEAAPAARLSVQEVIETLDLDVTVLSDHGVGHVPLAVLIDRFRSMAAEADGYISWSQAARLHRHLVAAGLAHLADRMRVGGVSGAAAATELMFARSEAIWKTAMIQSPILREMGMERRHDLVERFARLERARLVDNVSTILATHLAQLPQGAQGEMGVIRGEIGKKARHLPIRKLFERAGTAVQRIKPVLLMSPISVAQFLPPGALSFDLLVIDEASQVRPEDALGAIARAGQIVVVGDQKQLPPSSFFDRAVADEEDGDSDEEDGEDLLGGAAKVGEMESILTLCAARGLSPRMLKWHYRSRDPSLIEVSNREFYDNALVLPPTPLEKDPSYGLCFTRVDGVYDKGGKRNNRIEGDAIVSRVAEHARAHPTLSLGIVTFSYAQRNTITELLELARRSDTILDEFLREGQTEDVFVKNIENVQGDERDVILVSVGYGPATTGGRLSSMSFGPVNGDGGERRLNVLFTRARVRCEILASFDPGDIDVSRTASKGPRILKRFLDYAKNVRPDESFLTDHEADSPLEDDVADIIRSFGFLADPQVGSAGFRIDMGVRHPDKPGTYVLAVECDGATYHSALWARERDRLRQDVLEHLGWRFHRIWSTDWFYNRRAEVERLRVALLSAQDAAKDGIRVNGANRSRPAVLEPTNADTGTFVLPPVVVRQMPLYQRAVLSVSGAQEPHEVPVAILAGLAKRIVIAEGPIHGEEVARRVASCFGKEKAGARIVAATNAALTKARGEDSELQSDGTFWFTREQAVRPPVRDRSAETGATLKIGCISMLEIRRAIEIARDDNAGGDREDVIRTAARLLGYRRVGPDLQARIESGLA